MQKAWGRLDRKPAQLSSPLTRNPNDSSNLARRPNGSVYNLIAGYISNSANALDKRSLDDFDVLHFNNYRFIVEI